MSEIKQYERKYIFDELCSTCVKRVYINCDYAHSRADEPPCGVGKTLKQAYLKGSEDADMFHSEQLEQQLQELIDRAIKAFEEVMFDVMLDYKDGKFIPEDYKLDYFTQKLNEK